jgi:hypothetical protein
MTARFIDLDTGTVRETTDREFFCRLFGSDEQRAERDRQADERCIRAIQAGDTYGYPPVQVDRCRQLMALRDADASLGDPFEKPRRRAA